MKPKEIYELDTVKNSSIHWSETNVFFQFVDKEIDEDFFSWEDAKEDIRIECLLKAESLYSRDEDNYVAYEVITFDGKPVGFIRVCGRHADIWDRYITNYPLYQAMVGYVKTLYTPGDSPFVVGEDEEIENLEELYGWRIDKEAFSNMKEVKEK